MKITLDNYELYVMDFLEGNLEPRQQMAFNQFLDDHPGIRAEISGVDDLVLVPDMEIRYPDKSRLYRKKRATILPIWRVNRVVAAAVALLLISAAALFIWKSPVNPVTLSTDHTMTSIPSEINQPQLPTTRIPLPESRTLSVTPRRDTDVDRPETNVMAHKGKGPGREDDIRRSSPAQISGTETKPVQSYKEIKVQEVEHLANEVIPVREKKNADPETPVSEMVAKDPTHHDAHLTSVALLPVKSGELNPEPVALRSGKLTSLRPDKDTQEFKIHIPGEFLSETWTDVSLTNFKKKVIPEFIKNQLNL